MSEQYPMDWDIEGVYSEHLAGLFESMYLYEPDNPDAWIGATFPAGGYVVTIEDAR